MVKGMWLAVALLLSLPIQAMTQLSARVDKNPALQGEAITLEISADAKVDANALNFRVLEQDFNVMVPSISTSSQNIQGEISHSTSWRVVLLPKKSGEFTIPSFTLEGLSTEPITLQILEGSAKPANKTEQELFLQSSFDQTELHVQQLSYYQVTIYFNGDLQRGSLSEPQMDDASIIQIGQDSDGSELVNGIRYRTITRRYAITPQRSGSFTITPPTFSGEMIDRDSARYNYFARTKTVVQQAQPIDVTVQPIPDDFPGDWLVAGLVTLNEEWSPDLSTLKQGEPVTRIITLSAVDVAENQLPDLHQGFPEGIKLYQEQPQAKSAERKGRLVAQKVFTTAVIANKAGEIALPEIRLPWWNSQTNSLQYASIPARTLQVAASAELSTTAINTPQTATPASAATTNAATEAAEVDPWQWNRMSYLLLALWLISVFVFYLCWQLRSVKTAAIVTDSRVKFNASGLKQACAQHDAVNAKAQLLRFAHQQLDVKCQSLTELAKLLPDPALKAELTALNQALYGASATPWRGDALWQAWQQFRNSPSDSSDKAALSPLYPT